jgi:hypothetical protein
MRVWLPDPVLLFLYSYTAAGFFGYGSRRDVGIAVSCVRRWLVLKNYCNRNSKSDIPLGRFQWKSMESNFALWSSFNKFLLLVRCCIWPHRPNCGMATPYCWGTLQPPLHFIDSSNRTNRIFLSVLGGADAGCFYNHRGKSILFNFGSRSSLSMFFRSCNCVNCWNQAYYLCPMLLLLGEEECCSLLESKGRSQ